MCSRLVPRSRMPFCSIHNHRSSVRTVMVVIVAWPARQAACYSCPGCSRWKGEASQTNWCRRTAGERDGTFVWVAMFGTTMVAVPDSHDARRPLHPPPLGCSRSIVVPDHSPLPVAITPASEGSPPATPILCRLHLLLQRQNPPQAARQFPRTSSE